MLCAFYMRWRNLSNLSYLAFTVQTSPHLWGSKRLSSLSDSWVVAVEAQTRIVLSERETQPLA